MKPLALILTLSLFGTAPFQCGKPETQKTREDSAPAALWKLGERFRESGDEEARRLVLQTILDEYPRSREAQRAELALEGRDVSPTSTGGGEEEDAP